MNTENLANPTLDQLAETINAEHRACEGAVRAGPIRVGDAVKADGVAA